MPTIPEVCANVKGPHTWRGLSKIGYGMAKRILMARFPKAKPDGVFAKGSGAHAFYQQTMFPEGTTFKEGLTVTGMDNCPMQIPPFEVVGHEQYVFIAIGGVMRWSPIDTLVYYPDTNTFGVWDYKSKKNGKYGKKTVFDDYLTEPDAEHMLQVQLYLDRFTDGVAPTGHIFYIDNDDWSHVKVAEVEADPPAVQEAISKEERVALFDEGENWLDVIDCLHSKWCEKGYCDWQAECLARCQYAAGVDLADMDAVRHYLGAKP